jgi:hypothetical protein
MSENFVDLNGITHNVEFEEVIGITSVIGDSQRVAVHRKIFPRKLGALQRGAAHSTEKGICPVSAARHYAKKLIIILVEASLIL